jgi:hypothetical protein
MFDYNPEKKNGKFNSSKKKLIALIGKNYPYVDHIIQRSMILRIQKLQQQMK